MSCSAVAACASTHYVVSKETKLLRSVTNIRQLEKQERVTELARMLGGQSDVARKHAEALLNFHDGKLESPDHRVKQHTRA